MPFMICILVVYRLGECIQIYPAKVLKMADIQDGHQNVRFNLN